MNLKTALLLLAMGTLAVFGAGCSDDSPTTNDDPVSEFEGYEDWEQVEYTIANSDLLGPGAHQGGANDTYTRAIFKMDDTRDEAGEGTIYVKETFSWDASGDKEFAAAGGLLAMKKRAEGYHDNGNDWEYFMLEPSTLDVVNSGHGESGIGGCMGCHNGANSGGAGEDFIFAHPAEYIAHVDSFAGYENWTVIGTETGEEPLLQDFAHGAPDETVTRTIYKRQIKARPDNDWGYPVGTMLLKIVTNTEDEMVGKTGMVKRGGGFDGANGDWEYFMWDAGTGEIANQGALAGCIGCHSGATGTRGTDFVFAHDDDPFNN